MHMGFSQGDDGGCFTRTTATEKVRSGDPGFQGARSTRAREEELEKSGAVLIVHGGRGWAVCP